MTFAPSAAQTSPERVDGFILWGWVLDKIESMQLFVRLADTLSFSRTARDIGVSQSTVSKQLLRIEEGLGAQLVRRTTRGLSLTEAGVDYVRSARDILDGIDELESRISQGQVSPSGIVRVAMSPAFGRMYVIPHLSEFIERYPDVLVEFEVSDRHANLVGDGIDLAVRIGPLSDSTHVARRIGGVRYATVGTPAYFKKHGFPTQPQDVEHMPCVVFMVEGAPRAWRFHDGKDHFTVEAHAQVRSNDAEYLRASVLAGLGMGHSPSWLYADDLAAGRLVQVLHPFSPPSFPISAMTPAGRRQPGKVRAFTDFLAAKFESIPELCQ